MNQLTQHPERASSNTLLFHLAYSAALHQVQPMYYENYEGENSLIRLFQRLASLVPRPRVNLIRFHGVFAPNSKHRTLVTPTRRAKSLQEENKTPREKRKAMTGFCSSAIASCIALISYIPATMQNRHICHPWQKPGLNG